MPYVFSYGSNNKAQLEERLNTKIKKLIPAYIENYTRIFCFYSSKWKGSVASLHYKKNAITLGSLVTLTERELKILDTYETNYKRKLMKVYDNNFNEFTTFVYICNDTKFVSYPSKAYLDAIYKNIKEAWNIKSYSIPIEIKTKDGFKIITTSK
tara:strand:- start:676 stop:1137 length:462 start_codon:yes stop_codon:yes gene_type:complete